MRAVVFSMLVLAGCSSNTAWKVSAGSSGANVHVHASGDAAAAFGLALVTAVLFEANFGGDYAYGNSSRNPPEMAPDRRVSEQDCTKPLDLTQGNIRCK